MAKIDWDSIMNIAGGGVRKPQPNVRFFYAYNENKEKSLKEGRAIFDEIPSISIQWPGQDETVRRIEPRDEQEYPEKYRAFKEARETPSEGTPLSEFPQIGGSAMRELQYLGFRTVEQLAAATDDVKKKLGPLSRFVKLAQDWLDAAHSDRNEVVKLKNLLEIAEKKQAALAEKLELFMQRVEANEGTDLRGERKEVIQSIESEEDLMEGEESSEVKRRGRPRKA